MLWLVLSLVTVVAASAATAAAAIVMIRCLPFLLLLPLMIPAVVLVIVYPAVFADIHCPLSLSTITTLICV